MWPPIFFYISSKYVTPDLPPETKDALDPLPKFRFASRCLLQSCLYVQSFFGLFERIFKKLSRLGMRLAFKCWKFVLPNFFAWCLQSFGERFYRLISLQFFSLYFSSSSLSPLFWCRILDNQKGSQQLILKWQIKVKPDNVEQDAKNEEMAFKTLINGMKSLIGRVLISEWSNLRQDAD